VAAFFLYVQRFVESGLTLGGVLARFDAKTWQTYTASNSGYSGAEATTLARDGRGRLWIGTQTAGVDVFQLSR
jgi:hypothetical protein